jgi:DNA-binding beta-propeller fold protein YncE
MLATGLASAVWRDIDWVWGVNDVAILGDQLYALVGGGGVGHGNPDQPSGVYVIAADGSATLVADLGSWVDANPVEYTPPEGAPNEGSFFDMAPIGEALWVVDSVNGQVLEVTPAGEITRIADLSEGHPVPSGIAADPAGGAYVADLTPAPYVERSANVRHISLDGTVTDVWTGLTAVTGLAVGPDGALYVAELSSQISEDEPFLNEGSGRILRQTGPDAGEVVASGLDYPVALGSGPDGGLYVSVPAFGADNGTGEIIRLEVPATN